jgi:hypothetical protein
MDAIMMLIARVNPVIDYLPGTILLKPAPICLKVTNRVCGKLAVSTGMTETYDLYSEMAGGKCTLNTISREFDQFREKTKVPETGSLI